MTAHITVIKLGGSAGIHLDAFLGHVADFGEPCVLIHGANVELDALMRRVGVEPRMVTSTTGQVSRYTDQETMDLFLMAYCGKVNKRIVESLQRAGVRAVGLSGLDGALALARRKPRIRVVEDGKQRVLDGDYTGSIESIDAGLLLLLLERGYLPVITPPALSTDGDAVNVDGDKLAMEIAVALDARRLLIFSNTDGLLRDVTDPSSSVPVVHVDRLDDVLPLAHGRMKKKVLAAANAVSQGVDEVILANANRPDPVRAALRGAGTHIQAGVAHD